MASAPRRAYRGCLRVYRGYDMPLITPAEIRSGSGCDIFVSYAHGDDLAEPGEHGWVTRFVLHLDRKLTMQLGRKGASIFMDHSLIVGTEVTPLLDGLASKARALVLFLSRGYQQSDWCKREMLTFLDRNAPALRRQNVFVVEMVTIDRAEWYPTLRELKTVQMWARGPTEPVPRLLGDPRPSVDESNPYWQKINELAFALQGCLESEPSPPPDPAAKRVWIAEPVPELTEHWDLLKAALRREHIEVAPLAAHTYPRSAAAFKAAAEADLARCRVLVHLLGESPGPAFTDSSATPTGLQAHLIETRKLIDSGVVTLDWREPRIELEQIRDRAHRELLTGASRESFEQFRNAVLRACGAPPPPKPEIGDESLGICVAAGADDDPTATALLEVIDQLGHRAVQPPLRPAADQRSGEYQAMVDEIIQGCDGLIFVYGHESPTWIQAQYMRAQRLLAKRTRGLWGALLDAPPPPAYKRPSPRIADRRIMALDCRAGIRPEEIRRFIDALGGPRLV
jgi:hypothetical protein